MAEDTALVVVQVAVAAADALGLFDGPVEPFGAGVVDMASRAVRTAGHQSRTVSSSVNSRRRRTRPAT